MQTSERWSGTTKAAAEIQAAFSSLRISLPTFTSSLQGAREFAREAGLAADEQSAIRQIALIVRLAQSLEAVADAVPSLYAENGRPAELRWEHYAHRIIKSLDSYAPGLGIAEKRRFIVGVVPYLTGEIINEDTVKNATKAGNILTWRETG